MREGEKEKWCIIGLFKSGRYEARKEWRKESKREDSFKPDLACLDILTLTSTLILIESLTWPKSRLLARCYCSMLQLPGPLRYQALCRQQPWALAGKSRWSEKCPARSYPGARTCYPFLWRCRACLFRTHQVCPSWSARSYHAAFAAQCSAFQPDRLTAQVFPLALW